MTNSANIMKTTQYHSYCERQHQEPRNGVKIFYHNLSIEKLPKLDDQLLLLLIMIIEIVMKLNIYQ